MFGRRQQLHLRVSAAGKQLLWQRECSLHRSIILYSPSGTGVDEYAIKMQQKTTSWNFYVIGCHRGPIVRLIMSPLLLHILKEECVCVCLHTQVGCYMVAKNNRVIMLGHMYGWEGVGYRHMLGKRAYVSMFNWPKVKITDVGVGFNPLTSLFSTFKYFWFQ